MQIRDSRTGLSGEIRPARGRPLLVCVHVALAEEGPGLGDLRACLVADLLFRTLELGKAQVLVGYASEGLPEASAAVKDAIGRLGINPPTELVPAGGAREALGGPIGVHVVAPEAAHAATGDGVRSRHRAGRRPQRRTERRQTRWRCGWRCSAGRTGSRWSSPPSR